MSVVVDLKPGDRFRHGKYFTLEVKQMTDGVYPFVKTGQATMILPWRHGAGGIEVCLLRQSRVDTEGGVIFKICGGYNGNLPDEEAGLVHLRKKLGLVPGAHPVVWWRACLGVGPQYDFPIEYGFVLDPVAAGAPTAAGCSAEWMPLARACELATARGTPFFDDFSTAMLLVLLTNSKEL